MDSMEVSGASDLGSIPNAATFNEIASLILFTNLI